MKYLFIAIFACLLSISSLQAHEGHGKKDAVITYTLDLVGLTCDDCVDKVKKGLLALGNVTKVTIGKDDTTKIISAVVVVKKKTDVTILIAAVKKSGFDATEAKKRSKKH